jgi:hypothetical protein
MFSKTPQIIAKVAVGLATAATTSLGGSLAKHYTQSQKLIDTSRNAAASIVRPKSDKSR